ncbi:hypothetical protein O4J56_10510 [Nocardiopsis sp. RSe5-2]|uniref:Uncharacterized protein n=1 Tax=Nocardiopsis endophytica TaxID=3018445 RepID=A0ABT4U288_9ACTN|nr:hypothetical protein [Nocardiopsis endophytica]MDA2811068.1 hypothetical protein [Nocardiopsis endophytica]
MALSTLGRAVAVLTAAAAAAAALTGCSEEPDDTKGGLPEGYVYVAQGGQYTDADLSIGVGSISDGTAALHLSADDIDGTEVVRAGEGDTVEAGHRSITVHRVDEGDRDEEGVALTVDGGGEDGGDQDAGASEDASPSAEPSQGASASGDPLDDPAVFAALPGRRTTHEGVTFALGSSLDGVARILVSAEGHEDEEIEVETGDKVDVAGRTVMAVEVRKESVFLKFTD